MKQVKKDKAKVYHLRLLNEEVLEEITEVLLENAAISQDKGFTGVILITIDKEGIVECHTEGVMSFLDILGALEYAKMDIMMDELMEETLVDD